MIDFSASTVAFRGLSGPERLFSGAAGGFRPSIHQRSPRQVEVGQPDQREHLRGVLSDPLVAHLRVTELALDDAEHVFDPCPNRRHPVVEALVRIGEWMLLARLERNAPEYTGLASNMFERVIDVALVAEHRPVILTQQMRQLADIGLVGRSDRSRMHQPGIDVRADMNLHAEVPLVALLGLVHLGVALLFPVLRRGWRMDDRRIDHRAALEQQVLLRERVVDDVHHLCCEPMLFEQMPELEDRRLAGHRVIGQIQPGKATHRLDLVQRIFHRRVRQAVPLLHEVDPQHRRQRHRRTTTATALRVVRLDRRQQRCPGHHLVHLGQETLPARAFLLAVEGQRGEGRLFHGGGADYDRDILPALKRSELT